MLDVGALGNMNKDGEKTALAELPGGENRLSLGQKDSTFFLYFQTAYLIFFCSETHYEKCLKKVARFVVEQNEQVRLIKADLLVILVMIVK